MTIDETEDVSRVYLTALGRNIQKRRCELGMSQEVLAQKSAIDVFSLSPIENGHRSPSINTLRSIANTLQLDALDLIPLGNFDFNLGDDDD